MAKCTSLLWPDIHCPGVALNLVVLSIFFSGQAALMSADSARNLRSLVCSCLNSHCTFTSTFDFFQNWLLSSLISIHLSQFFIYSLYGNSLSIFGKYQTHFQFTESKMSLEAFLIRNSVISFFLNVK